MYSNFYNTIHTVEKTQNEENKIKYGSSMGEVYDYFFDASEVIPNLMGYDVA